MFFIVSLIPKKNVLMMQNICHISTLCFGILIDSFDHEIKITKITRIRVRLGMAGPLMDS